MGGITLDKAVLISLILESLLYGIFTVMFGFTLWVLIHERGGRINVRLLLPALVLYALATAHLTIDAYRDVKAFITYRDAPGGPIAYLTNLSSASYLLKSSFYTLQTLLGDFCMIYRCSVVWQHNIWIIILPILLWVSCAVTGVGVITSFSRVSPEAQVFSFARWVAAFFAITLATNVICTSLIALRIWSVDRAGGRYRETKSALRPVLAVVIESGAIYSASLTVLLAVYLSHSWAHFIVLDAITPIIGIVFSMIIVRMGLSMAWQNSSQSRSSLTTLRYNRQLATPPQPQSHFMHSIGMNMTTTTVDESQSMGKIGAQSDFKRKSFLPTWTASGENEDYV